MSGAGKGDDYRPVNKKVWDDNYERAFGIKTTEPIQEKIQEATLSNQSIENES
jgi:hypothetical protein